MIEPALESDEADRRFTGDKFIPRPFLANGLLNDASNASNIPVSGMQGDTMKIPKYFFHRSRLMLLMAIALLVLLLFENYHLYRRAPGPKSASSTAERPVSPPPHSQVPDSSPANATIETKGHVNLDAELAQDSEIISGYAPTRAFVGPEDFPPIEYPAYGVVAFPTLSLPSTHERYMRACKAFLSVFIASSSSGLSAARQMVTVWPIDSKELAAQVESEQDSDKGCTLAVDRYSLSSAYGALRQARQSQQNFQGIGPYLVAWAPSTQKGKAGVPVLAMDLSGATTEAQFQKYFVRWRDKIQQDSKLWNNGWSIELFKDKLSDFLDDAGTQLLSMLISGDK